MCLCGARFARNLFALGVFHFALIANAQSLPCPLEPFPQVLPESRAERLSELRRLDLLSETCLLRADYFAYRGALLVSLGRGAQAIEVLERALLLAPDSPGVQFDYAQALAQGGERQSASALLSMLLDRGDLHPDFRTLLQSQKAELLKPRWRFGFQVSSLLGHETNLNSAPDSRFFTFNSSGGDVVLEIDPAGLPKKGMGWLNSFAATGISDLGAGQAIYVLGDLRSRQSGGGTDYLQAEGSIIWRGPRLHSLPKVGYQPSLRLGISQLQFGGKTLFRGLRGEAGLEAPVEISVASCQARGGLALEDRQFPDSPTSDGRYTGIVASTHCLYNDQVISVHLNVGQDRPEGYFRAGGRQTRSELGLGWSRDYGRFEAQVIGAYSWAKDSDAYSPLLANGAVRRLDRYLARLELRVPVSPNWQWLVSVEESRQTSNIELFDIQSRSLYSGFRARFE